MLAAMLSHITVPHPGPCDLHASWRMCLQVRGAYYRFAGNADVGSFMKALGFPGFSPGSASSSAGPQDEFRRAIRATAEAASTQQSGASQRAVAESANARLREWQADYNAGGL